MTKKQIDPYTLLSTAKLGRKTPPNSEVKHAEVPPYYWTATNRCLELDGLSGIVILITTCSMRGATCLEIA